MPEESLESAEVMGGAVVTIGGDTSGLEQAEKRAKAIAQRLDSTSAKLKITADDSELRKIIGSAEQLIAGGKGFTLVPKIEEAAVLKQTQSLIDKVRDQLSAGLIITPTIRPGGGSTGAVGGSDAPGPIIQPARSRGPLSAASILSTGNRMSLADAERLWGHQGATRGVATEFDFTSPGVPLRDDRGWSRYARANARNQDIRQDRQSASAEATALSLRREAEIEQFEPRTGVEDAVGELVATMFGPKAVRADRERYAVSQRRTRAVAAGADPAKFDAQVEDRVGQGSSRSSAAREVEQDYRRLAAAAKKEADAAERAVAAAEKRASAAQDLADKERAAAAEADEKAFAAADKRGAAAQDRADRQRLTDAATAQKEAKQRSAVELENRLAHATPRERLEILREAANAAPAGSIERTALDTRAARMQGSVEGGAGPFTKLGAAIPGPVGRGFALLGTPSRLNPSVGVFGAFLGAMAMQEGLQMLGTAPAYGRETFEAGNNQRALVEADLAQRDRMTSGMIGQTVGFVSDRTGAKRAGIDLTLRAADNKERYTQFVHRDAEERLAAAEQHRIVTAQGEFARADATADVHYLQAERAARAEQRERTTQSATLRQDAVNTATADLAAGRITQSQFDQQVNSAYRSNQEQDRQAVAATDAKLAPQAADRDYAKSITAEQKASAMDSLAASGRSAFTLGEAADDRLKGHSIDALYRERGVARDEMETGLKNQIRIEHDPDLKRQLQSDLPVKLATFDAETHVQVAAAQRQEDAADIGLRGEVTSAGHAGDAARAEAAHDTRGGLEARLAGQRDSVASAALQRITESRGNERLHAGAVRAAEAQLGKFDESAGTFGGGGSVDAQAAAERKRLAEQEQSALTQLTAEAAANRQRITHETFQAEITSLQALKKVAETTGDAATRSARVGAVQSQIDLTNQMQAEHRQDVSEGADASVAAAEAHKNRDSNTASLATFDAATKREIRHADAVDRPDIERARAAERGAIVADQQLRSKVTTEDYSARETAANQESVGQRDRANATLRTRALVREAELLPSAEATSAAARRARAAGLKAIDAELNEQKSALTGHHGGAVVSGESMGAAGAEILAGRIHGQQDKAIANDIDKAITQVNGGGAPGRGGRMKIVGTGGGKLEMARHPDSHAHVASTSHSGGSAGGGDSTVVELKAIAKLLGDFLSRTSHSPAMLRG